MIEQAVALNPNLVAAWLCWGFVGLMCCDPERAIDSFDRMIRLSPCGIRGKAASDSDGRRPVIPIESGHPIRTKAATLLIG
jgi:hypothetical protein